VLENQVEPNAVHTEIDALYQPRQIIPPEIKSEIHDQRELFISTTMVMFQVSP